MSISTVNAILSTLSFRDACLLHQRLLAGRTDAETRGLLRQAIAKHRSSKR